MGFLWVNDGFLGVNDGFLGKMMVFLGKMMVFLSNMVLLHIKLLVKVIMVILVKRGKSCRAFLLWASASWGEIVLSAEEEWKIHNFDDPFSIG